MRTSLLRGLETALALLTCLSSARGSDHYVDAVLGNDANDGSAPALAWRTITHAIATLPYVTGTATELIHVAPGTYTTAIGEVFPLRPKARFQIVGDAGPESTVLDGGGTGGPLVLFTSACQLGGNAADPDTIVRGLTLWSAGYGVQVEAQCGPQEPTLLDLVIRDMSVAGVRGGSISNPVNNRFRLALERVRIENCAIGVDLEPHSTTCAVSVATLTDCSVFGSAQQGLRLVNPWGRLDVSLARTAVTGNGTGLRVEQAITMGSCAPVQTRLVLADSAVCGQIGSGIVLVPQGAGASLPAIELRLARSTVAWNGGTGIDAFATSAFLPLSVAMESCIVHANADDVRENPALPSFSSVSRSEVGDGDFAGANGNFSADPRFRSPAAGDWRLAFGSPCIDAGDPATPPGTLDLARAARPIDGDLDTVERADIGALEFAPLAEAAPAHLGGACMLELWGPAGGSAILVASRDGRSPPIVTPFGEYELEGRGVRWGRVPLPAAGPALVSIPLSPNPVLLGRTLSFQALCPSTIALPPFAWSNAVTVTIVP